MTSPAPLPHLAPAGTRPPRVLMLGWEFPPHISGGLGTACQGLCEGLVRAGVEVTLVLPRAQGGERALATRVVPADRVRLREDDGPSVEPPLLSAPLAPGAGRRLLTVDSPLSPYLTAASYGPFADYGPGRSGDPVARRAGVGPERWDEAGWAAWARRVGRAAAGTRGACTDPVPPGEPETLPFTGGYGQDLFDEVARYARVVAALAAREDFDLVHGHDWMTAPAALAAAEAAGAPLVMHAHALECDRSGEHPDPRVEALEAMGLRAADRAVCVSHLTRRRARRRYGIDPARLRVVHNGIQPRPRPARISNLHGIPACDSKQGPTVLFLGRVTAQKGPEAFLRAAAQVHAARPDVTFVMAGDGDQWRHMVELSAELGLGRAVRFTGFLRGLEVERQLAAADLYVLPSASEPFGISGLEAMALGVPVLLSRTTGVAEVAPDAPRVDCRSPRKLAQAMLELLGDEARLRELGELGRRTAEGSGWELRGAQMRAVYEELGPYGAPTPKA